jgi:isopentenyldiphosphate isomerase
MLINELKKELGLSDKDIAEFLGLKNAHAYRTSSARQRYEKAICSFYAFVKSTEGGQKK